VDSIVVPRGFLMEIPYGMKEFHHSIWNPCGMETAKWLEHHPKIFHMEWMESIIHMESAKFDGFHMDSMWNVGAQ
jgi:hypothetical protein